MKHKQRIYYMNDVMIFDIETVPDTDSVRKIHNLDKSLSDEDVMTFAFAKRRETHNNEFMPHHLHKIVAISVVLRSKDMFRVWSLGDAESSEKEIIERFFAGIDRYSPTLVSWNGSGFDLPVLHYRALLHGVRSERYWDLGDDDRDFKWNNYISRFHYRHTDLMDVLAGFQGRTNAPLDQIAIMLGLPGKMGMSGSSVSDYYLQGKIKAIRDYCETDVLNTYLVYLRWLMIRGNFTAAEYDDECQVVKDFLATVVKESDKYPHFDEFLSIWQAADND